MELSVLGGPLVRLLVVFIWLFSSNLHAYPTPVDFNGAILRWNITIETPIRYYEIVTPDNNDTALYSDFVYDSASKWNAVDDSYIELRKVVDDTSAHITIEFIKDHNTTLSSGFAVFDSLDQDSNPLHCKIIIYTDTSNNSYIRQTITHELGHCLGLGHSLIPESIMSYDLDNNSLELDIDDEAALTRLYPRYESQAQLPIGCSVSAKHNNYNFFVLILLTLVPLITCYPRHWI